MTVNCASNRAQHPRRFYYKCLSDKNHRRSFLWCDEYHSQHQPEHVPKFLSSQEWSPSSVATESQNDSISPPDPNESKDHDKSSATHPAQSGELDSVLNEFRGSCSVIFLVFTCVVAVFMCFVLVLLGFVLGKLT